MIICFLDVWIIIFPFTLSTSFIVLLFCISRELYHICVAWYVLIFKTHFTVLSFKLFYLPQISGKDHITTLWENIRPFCILLKCRHLKYLRKALLLPFSSISYPIKFPWNYILLIHLVRIFLFCFMNLFYHIFVPISCILDVQEGLCNFALKAYFDMLHFIIYIHRNPEILVFIS